MKRNKLTISLFYSLFMAFLLLGSSCTDDLELSNGVDESKLEGIYENRALLVDGKTGKSSNLVDLYASTYQTTVCLNSTKGVLPATSAKVKVDEAYLSVYNAQHGQNFKMYPLESVTLANEGVLTWNALSNQLEVELSIQAAESLEANQTYVLPLTLTEGSSDMMKKEVHCVYLLKDQRGSGDCFKGDDLPKGILIVEVNDVNPLNALSFQLQNGKYFWDAVVLFAANINYDAKNGRPFVSCNANVQFLLDNNEAFLQPLRKRGMKVLLGVLGNGDMAGLNQLSKQGAQDFARELAQYCYAYNLDGVSFDNEYSLGPDLNNPAFANPTIEAAGRLCYETKKAMPDKLVSVYDYNGMYGCSSVDGVDVAEWLDIVYADYPVGEAHPVGNLTYKNCSGVSKEFAQDRGTPLNSYMAGYLKQKGYGWHMGFAPYPEKYPQIFGWLDGAQVLYGSKLKNPTVFYKKNDAKPYKYPDDLK